MIEVAIGIEKRGGHDDEEKTSHPPFDVRNNPAVSTSPGFVTLRC